MSKCSVVSYLAKPTFLSIYVDRGKGVENFRLNSTHPTFKSLMRAVKRDETKRIPKLLSLAENISNQTHGNVVVKKDGVYIKGRKVESALARRINELVAERESVAAFLKFMDNLFKNPSEEAQSELYEWLVSFNNGKFVPSDDGCFYAYKVVNPDYTDCYTGTVLNAPGERPLMPRKDVDPDRRNECSRGYHFCSRNYVGIFNGWKNSGNNHVMLVKVNPKDVVAIPKDYNCNKGRTWTYEVVREFTDFNFDDKGDHPFFQQLFVPVMREKSEILKALYELPNVKRILRKRKLTKMSLRKASTERLRKWYEQLHAQLNPPDMSKLFENPLKNLVLATKGGVTIGMIAEELDVPYKTIYNAVNAVGHPPQEMIDLIIEAIAKLRGTVRSGGTHNASYPTPVAESRNALPAAVEESDVEQTEFDGLYEDPYGYRVIDEDEELMGEEVEEDQD